MSDQQLEVWFLIGMLPIGGSERTLVDLANGLDKSSYSVTVWTIIDDGPLRGELDTDVRYKTLNASGKWDIRAPVRFLREVRAENPDVLQSFLFFDNILARIAGLTSSNVDVITGVREVPEEPSWFRSVIDKVTLALSDRIVSNSEAGADHIISRGADPAKVKVVRNGRKITKYANGNKDSLSFDCLNLDSSNPIVGTVGRLVERKGHYDLLEAWPTVLETHPNAQLLIVGDGPERKSLQNRAGELNCSHSICFAGRRDDVPNLLAAMDIFVFPSHYEGLPGALLEAMIAGLPIVTTPVDGNSELVEDGVTGLFVPPNNSQALANQLLNLLSNPELRGTLGANAAEFAKDEFAIMTMISEFESVYEDL